MTVFLNAAGDRQGISRGLSEFLDYVRTSVPKDGFTKKIQGEIDHVSQSPEWRKELMTLEMRLRDEREEGRQEGLKSGIIHTGKVMKLSDKQIIGNLAKVCGIGEAEAAMVLREFELRQDSDKEIPHT